MKKNFSDSEKDQIKQVVKNHLKSFDCMPDAIKINGIIYTKNNYIKFLD